MAQIAEKDSPMCIHCLEQIGNCACKLSGLPGMLRAEVRQSRKSRAPSGQAVFDLLCCAYLAGGMRGNKNKLVFFDNLHRVLELDVVKYGGEDDVLLIYLKKVE